MLLTFKDVCFSYDRTQDILRDVNFSLEEGEKVALLGLNGSGKSTLLLHTNGLLLPKSGDVTVNGISTFSKNVNEIRKLVGLVFQNPDDQLFMPTVWDDVAFGPRNMKISEEEIIASVENALNLTHTHHLSKKASFELSGGQKKSVSIATVLSMNPLLLVMDEPTSGLDHEASENYIRIMQSLPQAALISTHDFNLAKRICSRAIVLSNGAIVYDGDIMEADYPACLFL